MGSSLSSVGFSLRRKMKGPCVCDGREKVNAFFGFILSRATLKKERCCDECQESADALRFYGGAG
jgi:hypothetical protein